MMSLFCLKSLAHKCTQKLPLASLSETKHVNEPGFANADEWKQDTEEIDKNQKFWL